MALTPEQLAELQRLRQMFAPLAEQERRRQQAQWNAEQAAKKQGMAKGGRLSADTRPVKFMDKPSIVPYDVAQNINMQTNLPTSPEFMAAVQNTPSAELTPEGLKMGLRRFQKPEQSGDTSVRQGVFYLPKDSANIKHYKKSNTGYGGTEEITGDTLVRNPLFAKGATGGKAPEAAFDMLMGKGATKKLADDIMKVIGVRDKGMKEEAVAKLLEQYGLDADDAWHILQNSSQGNQLRYALQERIIGHAARKAGHDAILGYSKGRGGKGEFLSELFDLREADYPTKQGGYRLNPEFEKAQGGSVSKNPFDYQNKKHLHEVAKHLVKQGKFPLPKGIGATDILRDVLSSGKWQTLDDPRVNAAMRAAGHDSYYTQEKTGKQLNPIEGMKAGGKAGGDQYQELLKRHTKGKRLSKAENELLGLYHRVGGGKKLRKPVQEYKFETAPNPKVNMAPEKIITPEDLVGGYGIPFIGDSSMAGRLLTGAEGHQFDQPVELEGGHDYMRANAMHADPLQRAIWASALAKINHLTKKAKRVSESGEPVYGIHTSMSPTGVDFSHMPAEVLAELVKKAKITKKAKAAFNKEMRAQHPDFPGVDHPELHEMLRAKGSGNLRKHFVERMATDPYQEAGFPEIAMARLAVQHPNLMKYDRPGQEFVGSSIGRFRPDFGQVERPVNPHHSYPNVIGGEYVGALHGEKERPLLTTTEFFPEFHKQRREFNAPKAGDRRAFELAQPVQKFDQQWLDQVMPLYLARRKKLVGKADGGAVDIAEIGVEEAPNLPVKAYSPFNFDGTDDMPFGGVDLDPMQQGKQLLSPNTMQTAQQPAQQPPMGQPPAQPQAGSNILQMTPQGKAMAAMKPTGPAPAKPAGMKVGGKVTMPSTDGMRYALTVKSKKAK